MTINDAPESVLDTLGVLRERVGALSLPLELPGAHEARRTGREIVAQLDDYVLPRLRELDAPLLAVVGGSTGAGKSTLVNALVGRPSARPACCGPTTRSPVLAHHPADAALVHRRTGSSRTSPGSPPATRRRQASCSWCADEAVPPGLALLDAPDVDSVVTREPDCSRSSCSQRPTSGCS